MRRFLILLPFLACMAVHAQPAEIGAYLRKVPPATVHTLFEVGYVPSVSGSKYGMPIVRFDLNYIEYKDPASIGEFQYHSTWGNAFGFGGPGVIFYEEFITAGLSYRAHRDVAVSVTWEPLGLYSTSVDGVAGSGLTTQLALPRIGIEWNERAQGFGFGFIRQSEPGMRIRNIKVRFQPKENLFISINRYGITSRDEVLTGISVGVGF